MLTAHQLDYSVGRVSGVVVLAHYHLAQLNFWVRKTTVTVAYSVGYQAQIAESSRY
ncbi:MAG: hypothetical protein AAGF93_08855 [Cyanobacteria bacterium P01_H01_bin.105]